MNVSPSLQLNSRIEHTLLKAEAKESDIQRICHEAIEHHFRGVCIYPSWLETARATLSGSTVKLITVIGFPHGCASSSSKAFEAEDAIRRGADEIDMVVHLGLVKTGLWERVKRDIEEVKKACGNKTLKVILETSLLTDEEKTKVCEASLAARADYVKTSTGFAGGGATLPDIQLMRATAGDKLRIKASGGIRSREDALTLIQAGADTLGTSSGILIVGGASNPSTSPEKY